jgi:hypothetical protein
LELEIGEVERLAGVMKGKVTALTLTYLTN